MAQSFPVWRLASRRKAVPILGRSWAQSPRLQIRASAPPNRRATLRSKTACRSSKSVQTQIPPLFVLVRKRRQDAAERTFPRPLVENCFEVFRRQLDCVRNDFCIGSNCRDQLGCAREHCLASKFGQSLISPEAGACSPSQHISQNSWLGFTRH